MRAQKKVRTRRVPRPAFAFTLWLRGPNILTTRNQNALYEAGCGDATFGAARGEYYAKFERIAATHADAVIAAMHQIEIGLPSARVVRVESDGASRRGAMTAINNVLELNQYVHAGVPTAEKRAVATLAAEGVKALVGSK